MTTATTVTREDVSTIDTNVDMVEAFAQIDGSPVQSQSSSILQSVEHPSPFSKLSSSHYSSVSFSFPSPQPKEHLEGVPLQVQSFSI